jgi:atypical dual specificity phosphatase
VTIYPGTGFTIVIPERLAVMGRPGMYSPLPADLEFLRGKGVGGVVSLTVTPLDAKELAAAQMAYLHEPVPDFTAPSVEQMERIVAFIDDHRRERGQMVLVHCGAGLGRSGTVAACYLVHDGLGAREAIDRVRQVRPHSVETAEQEDAVEAYARHLGR